MTDKLKMTERQRNELQLLVLNTYLKEAEETGFASVTEHSLAIISMHYAMLLDKSLEVEHIAARMEESHRNAVHAQVLREEVEDQLAAAQEDHIRSIYPYEIS